MRSCTVGPLGQLFVPPVTRISHRHVYMHAEIGSRAAIHRACPAPFADPLNQWLASQSKVDKAEGKQGLAGLRERASRSRHVGEGNDQGRGCCDQAGLPFGGPRSAALTMAANAPQRQQIALARQKRCSFLKPKKISAWSTRRGRMRKKITAELSQAIEPPSSRTAAGRPPPPAKSGAASDRVARSCPPVLP